MAKFRNHLQCFLHEEAAVTSLEYMVMAALIVVVCLTAIVFVGNSAGLSFSTSAEQIAGSGT